MRIVSATVAALVLMLITGCASIDGAVPPEAKQSLAPTGKLRVGLYMGNPLSVVRDSASQEMKGMGFDLGKEMARRIGVPFEPVVYPSVGAVMDATTAGQWDIAFFLMNPSRTPDVDFTAPLVELELGYLVPSGSSISTLEDVDRPG